MKLLKTKRSPVRKKTLNRDLNKGSNRRPISFENACKKYPNRFTMEHIPFWAGKPIEENKYYAPQFRTDLEWYDNTKFFNEPGWEGPNKEYCHTIGETWPLGLFLHKPYTKSES
jgi:hypothetical protein